MSQNSPDLARMIERYGNELYRLCYMHLQDRHLAEDALQETFLNAYRRYDSLKKPESEKAWLTGIAINACRNLRRSSWWKRILPMEDMSGLVGSVREEPETIVLHDELTREIAALKPVYREVILLHYYQGFKTREIAQILGARESTVGVRLARAREILKNNMERRSQYE